VVASEILIANSAVRNLIREGKVHQIYSVMQAGGRFGMRTMDASLAELVRSGRITQQLAMERSHDPEELNRLLGSAPPTQSMNGGAGGGGGYVMGGAMSGGMNG
jgi:twitching motility protein PilT